MKSASGMYYLLYFCAVERYQRYQSDILYCKQGSSFNLFRVEGNDSATNKVKKFYVKLNFYRKDQQELGHA